VSLRAYLEIVIGAILLGALWYFGFHERSVEHTKDVTADTAAVTVQSAKDTATIASDAAIAEKEARDYAKAINTAVAGAPTLRVCINAPSPVLTAPEAQARPRSHGAPELRAADPSVPTRSVEWSTAPLVQIGHDADARVKGLQDYIVRVCPSL
jgi:hypothetical protein